MEQNKKMKVKDLVEKYKTLTDEKSQENLIKSIIKDIYVPVLEKKVIVQQMLDKSLVKKDTNVFVDTFLNKINLTMGILNMYTTLDFSKDEEDDTNIIDDYDLLVQNGIIEIIFALIPENEIDRVLKIQKDVLETFCNEYKTSEAFWSATFRRIMDSSKEVINGIVSELMNVVNDEEKLKTIKENLENVEKGILKEK